MITDEMVNAAAREMWNDRDARHGGSWDERDPREVCVIQTKATARAALSAALSTSQPNRMGTTPIADELKNWFDRDCFTTGTKQLIARAVAALAQPDFPLRGRDALDRALEKARQELCETPQDQELGTLLDGFDFAAEAALSASPPEQPAADPVTEWHLIDVKPDQPMMADLFYRDLFFTDYKTNKKISAIMERGRDERFGIGWWDGETWFHSGTAHELFENYSEYPKEQFPTHWRALSPTVPNKEAK